MYGRIFLFFLVIGLGMGHASATAALPDSLLTEDKVYEYTFSDFEKAWRIMQQIRQRKVASEFSLDQTEGDLYFNTGKYYRALKFYYRALESDSVRHNDERYMDQIHRLISCYDCLHNEARKTYYVELLLKKAEACGDKAMQSVALFNMGKMIYYQGNRDKGYEYMQRAAALMEQTDYKYKYDNLRYDYNTLLVFYEKNRCDEEALKVLDRLERVVTKETGREVPIEALAEKEQKALYAHRAIVLFRLGRVEEATGYYRRFLAWEQVYPHDNYLIMPYLFDRKMYDEIIRMNTAREANLIAEGDTVNYHMVTIKRSLGDAYKKKGDYRMASRYFESLAILRDSIKNREQKSAALELAALYDANEKDLFIQKQAADMRMRNVWLVFIACGVGVLGVFLVRSMGYNRKIRRKNKAMVGTIETLLGYKEDLYLTREENLALKERLELALSAEKGGTVLGERLGKVSDETNPDETRADEKPRGGLVPEDSGQEEVAAGREETLQKGEVAGKEKISAKKDACGEAETGSIYRTTSVRRPTQAETAANGPSGAIGGEEEAALQHHPLRSVEPKEADWYDRALFDRVQHEIVKSRLYLQPDFSREELIKTIYIPKNKFAQLFKQYAGKSFPNYINTLRLEHAAKMLKEYPEYTVDSIARSCGMSTVQTFHRLFLEKFGVTPAEFRTGLHRSGNECASS